MSPSREVWFWLGGPEMSARGLWVSAERVSAVKGFMGTAPAIFVGLNPSTRKGSPGDYDPDEFLYNTLADCKLDNAHVTDLFKVRCKKKEMQAVRADATLRLLHRGYFLEELGIVMPEVVVVMGNDTMNVLLEWDIVKNLGYGQYGLQAPNSEDAKTIPVIWTYHPSATRYPNRRVPYQDRFRQDCAKARGLLSASPKGSSGSTG
jgi:uracil-DNA glycosylase